MADNPSELGPVTGYMATIAMLESITAITKGKDPTPSIMATGGLYVIFILGGQLGRWDIVKAFAGLLFVVVIISRGVPLFNSIGKLVTGLQVKSKQPTSLPSSGVVGGSTGKGSSGSPSAGNNGGGGGW